MVLNSQTSRNPLQNITFANTFNNPFQKKIIQCIEKVLIGGAMAQPYEKFCHLIGNGIPPEYAISKACGLNIKILGNSYQNIPQSGSTIVIANHPYGIIDTISILDTLSHRRKDIKILGHKEFSNFPQISHFFLPIYFDKTSLAKSANRHSINLFKEHLLGGGLGVIFPSGAVSTRNPIWRYSLDPTWHVSVGKWAKEFQCHVLPIFIFGECGFLFHFVSHLSTTLRLGTLMYENYRKLNSELQMIVGNPIDVASLPESWDAIKLTEYFRSQTYELPDLNLPHHKG